MKHAEAGKVAAGQVASVGVAFAIVQIRRKFDHAKWPCGAGKIVAAAFGTLAGVLCQYENTYLQV